MNRHPSHPSSLRPLALLLAVGFVSTGCGGDDSNSLVISADVMPPDDSTPTEATTATEAEAAALTVAPVISG
ncbi:MAG: hypothetical protein LH616_13250 [Ilumatobacteraceae bacterium]|nr:hypothetical protein [Ilumatobacteraceae bacterium]